MAQRNKSTTNETDHLCIVESGTEMRVFEFFLELTYA